MLISTCSGIIIVLVEYIILIFPVLVTLLHWNMSMKCYSAHFFSSFFFVRNISEAPFFRRCFELSNYNMSKAILSEPSRIVSFIKKFVCLQNLSGHVITNPGINNVFYRISCERKVEKSSLEIGTKWKKIVSQEKWNSLHM